MKIARALGMTAGLVGLAVTVSPKAFADENSGFYVGASGGLSKARIADGRIEDGLLDDGFATTSITNDYRHFGFKAFGGYEFNRYFSLEAGYFDLGRFGFWADTIPRGSLRGETKIDGANFDALGHLPIGDKFSLFARAGLNYADAKDSFSGAGAVAAVDPSPRRWSTNYKFGFGGEYDFNRIVGMRIEAERYRINDAVGNKGDVDLYSAGVVLRFGSAQPAPMPPPPPPAPVVAAEPAPPPPPPPRPPPPTRTRVTFSADSLFAFGMSDVQPAGRRALDAFAAELKGDQFEVITVTGYTDRIGSQAYNVKLSQRRAEAVKSYLVETAGIPADKVNAQGADGSDPVTKPEDCPGTKRTPKLIACLQPDRRVDVEVVGSRLQAAPAN
jgi:OOP family OmpA-OmpF porin